MKKTYIYKGQQEVYIPMIGVVRPNQHVTVDKEINNFLFEEKQDTIKSSKKK